MITFANENPDYYVRDVWLDRIQVMASREKADSTVGFYLAAKGGNNHESHNHNDVGSFLLYHDGEPLFIDVGVGEYTAQTFSEQRYTIWTMQSAYHNLPTIGQTQQQAGKEFQAKHVDYSAAPEKVRFSLDISDCYPDSAKLKFWQRSYLLKRTLKPSFTIIDQFELEEAQVITINYMLSQEPYQLTDRVIKLSSTKDLVMIYDPKIFRVKWERIPINDQRLSPVWGEAIFRLLLITKMPISEGNWRFEVLECEKSR